MISNGLLNWQQIKRFRIENDVVYGVYQSVGFAVSEEDGGKLFVFMLSGPDAAFDALEGALASQRGSLREVQVGDVENYLALFFDESAGLMTSGAMDALLDFVSANARALGFRTPNVCVKCGAPAQKRAFYKNMVQPMCANCREAEKNAAARSAYPAPGGYNPPAPGGYNPPAPGGYNPPAPPYGYQGDLGITRQRPVVPDEAPAKNEGPRGPGDMGKGILGALLGAVAGLIPYFISVLAGLELSALCFLAGIGAAIGYTAFNGLRRKNTALGVIIAFAEVLSVATLIAVKAINGGISTMFADTMGYINLAMAVFGALLGVSVCIDRINKHIG